jgi:tyrosine-protein phosphatase SIW14
MMSKRKNRIFFVLALVLLLNSISTAHCTPAEVKNNEARPEHWAVAIKQEGLPNFHKVSDTLYRGAQPREQGFEELKKLGIKTVINLRRSTQERILVEETGLKYYHIPMFAAFPKKKKFTRFLEIVSNPSNHPVFVHCKHGADRTGAAVAIYRIKIQNWAVEEAINEMVYGGYNFHRIYSNLKKFVRKF